ncbi:MAG TPA: YkgJ family cysteine cluster protein [Methanoregula sp.]|nr:YkgJ family cysteine cluster protein [Methanoregula sp.]
MAEFECEWCGKCCASLGPHIMIERQLNDRDYYCRSVIDNSFFSARVDPAFCEEIADEFETGETLAHSTERRTCRFLRQNPDRVGMVCAIYATRPKVCRDFRCYRMLIRTREGIVCGRVIGKNTLRTEDAALEKIWHERVAAVPYGDAAAWAKTVGAILAGHGYRADPVE